MSRVQVVLDESRDADILHWLDTQENKSGAIREAIRETIQAVTRPQGPVVDLGAIRQVVREELKRVSVSRASNGAGSAQAGDVDPEAGALLDEMF